MGFSVTDVMFGVCIGVSAEEYKVLGDSEDDWFLCELQGYTCQQYNMGINDR